MKYTLTRLIFFLLVVCCLLRFPPSLYAQEQFSQNQTFIKGKVISVVKEGTVTIGGMKNPYQVLSVELLEGKESGKRITVEQGGHFALMPQQAVAKNSTVILTAIPSSDGKLSYTIYDSYRLNTGLYVLLAFFVIVIFFTGKKGFGAILGLTVSLFVILSFIVPQLLAGHDPLTVSIIGACGILIVTTYLAHGFSKASTIAAVSSLMSLIITAVLSVISVSLMHLAGLGTEEASILQLNTPGHINTQGLLLGGIIIGTLGALNDVTTTQVAAVFALRKANQTLDSLHLAEEAFLIGREHILSLVNTLVLAYAGSALAIFIFFVLNPQNVPYWVILNSESVMEEFIRTVTSSVGLILAVPISTFLTAWYLSVKKENGQVKT